MVMTPEEQTRLSNIEAENTRLRHPTPGGSISIYVWGQIALAAAGLVAIILLTLLREVDSTPIIVLILGFLVPIVTWLQAAAQKATHEAVNGKLVQLMTVTSQRDLLEGKELGRAEAGVAGVEAAKAAGEQVVATVAATSAAVVGALAHDSELSKGVASQAAEHGLDRRPGEKRQGDR